MLIRTWLVGSAILWGSLAPVAGEDGHSVQELSWLAGYWRGEGLGGQVEEIWSAPQAGTMMGTFRLMKDGEVQFYEFMVLTREADGIVMKIKHYTPALSGWEEKDDFVRFDLLELLPNHARFEGLTAVRTGDELEIKVQIHSDDGSVREEPFRYRRYQPQSAVKEKRGQVGQVHFSDGRTSEKSTCPDLSPATKIGRTPSPVELRSPTSPPGGRG